MRWASLCRFALTALSVFLTACNSGSDDEELGSSVQAADRDVSELNCAGSAVDSSVAIPETPVFTLDPMGPLFDVTCEWQHFQAAEEFCVKIDAAELTPGGTGPLTTGDDPACRNSGFSRNETNLLKVAITAPPLCEHCRRLFIDLSQIPDDKPDQFLFYAHGHVFYRISSLNPLYFIDPVAHSPNTKNFTNDKLVSPTGSLQELLVSTIDHYALAAYVTHTTKFAHTAIQGPYYIGPWYLNREGKRIQGVYLDVDLGAAQSLGNSVLDGIHYLAGYNSGQFTCPDNLVPGFGGVNILYAGCVDRAGGSSIAINPYP